uniref:BLM10_mid domain-containing protein n=1 Tax=Toxocara canis TaxID=6265 RepID=A0A183U6F9_TOXCA
LGSDLWKYLSDSASEKWQMDLAHFARHFLSLIGPSTDRYVEMLLPAEHILEVCARCARVVDMCEGDEQFLLALATHMVTSYEFI